MEAKPIVLYVEDEGIVALAVGGALEDAGFEVDHVADGSSAMARLNNGAEKYVALVTVT